MFPVELLYPEDFELLGLYVVQISAHLDRSSRPIQCKLSVPDIVDPLSDCVEAHDSVGARCLEKQVSCEMPLSLAPGYPFVVHPATCALEEQSL